MNKLKMSMVAMLLGVAGSPIRWTPTPEFQAMPEPTGGYPVTDRHTGKAKERREAKRRRRAKGESEQTTHIFQRWSLALFRECQSNVLR